MIKEQRKYLNEYDKGKSICTCGHLGDGSPSSHITGLDGQPGHGACRVRGCLCEKFTWADYSDEYKEYLKLVKKDADENLFKDQGLMI
ncbi:MAG: hypothetical protein EHM49_00725 [Deltaproteobacteria bacterium]|nr:MAG: hypothetical protein EHM49_00725 [Deltaproteobacteria bacterium]